MISNIHSMIESGARRWTNDSGNYEKSWARRLLARSLQDLIAIFLPYMTSLVAVMMGACYVYDPGMKLLLYSSLPENFQNWFFFGIFLVEEMRFLMMIVGILVPAFQLQVIGIDAINHNLHEALLASSEQSNVALRKATKALRSLQLYIRLLNTLNRHLIFTVKIFSISTCVISGYAAIAHFTDYPIFGVMYYVITVEGMLIYPLVYAKGVKIPGIFQKVRSLLRVVGRGLADHGYCKELERQLASVPPVVGIQVGGFHVLERNSIPVFLHYIVTNIVNMIVAYM